MRQHLIIVLLALSLPILAQDYPDLYAKSLNINQTGMYVLGGWALANIATGAYGWSKYDGNQKYFHQMNLFWNTVNLTIAGIGLYSAIHTDPSVMNTNSILSAQQKTENTFLINAGLDVLYMAGGYYMMHLSQKKEKYRDLLNGYGKSVMLQGAFLFVFDLVMYGIQHHHGNSFGGALSQVALSPNALTLRFVF
ncbi:hypothetical protein ACE1ET_17240 [Saccharicrinis sp. FJH62]|uniref:DUF6992 family protein n=1 Tax=Saccharicrinis sp. FJH62 TaxID=3344657 RepID=UPI0035D41EAA